MPREDERVTQRPDARVAVGVRQRFEREVRRDAGRRVGDAAEQQTQERGRRQIYDQDEQHDHR